MNETRIRVLIVDDHEIVREGLRTLIVEESELAVVGEATDGEEALRLALELRPDVILLDLMMPGIDGIEVIRRLRHAEVPSRVLVLTSFAEHNKVHDAISAGAIGYLLKDILKADLVRAIRNASQGQPSLHPEVQRQLMRRVVSSAPPPLLEELTGRERVVLQLIAKGQSNKGIAAELGLSEGTVKGYVSAILAKLGVADRTQAALYAVKHGLVPSTDV
jgi:two-component system, NarL family, response regulator LiaR